MNARKRYRDTRERERKKITMAAVDFIFQFKSMVYYRKGELGGISAQMGKGFFFAFVLFLAQRKLPHCARAKMT